MPTRQHHGLFANRPVDPSARFSHCLAWVALLPVLVLAALLSLSLSGCTADSALDPNYLSAKAPTGFGADDLNARTGARTRSGTVLGGGGSAGARGAELYPGTEARMRSSAEPGISASGEGYLLNFENADVAAVIKAVMGDVLKANYTVDGRVSGSVSISSARPVSKASLIPVLETALKSVDATIVNSGGVYRVVPSPDGIGGSRLEVGSASGGYGVTVIPVKYVSVATLAKLMENFVTKAGAIRPDPASGIVLVMGTTAERRAALDAAAAIDIDIMRAQSVGIFPLANSSPETVVGEMQKIASSGEGGWAQGQVQFQPMDRMSAVLVIARSNEMLKSAGRWIQRLDRLDPAAVGVKVYKLRYAPAAKVAGMLNDIFSGRSGSTPVGTSDRDALQPSSASEQGKDVQTGEGNARSGVLTASAGQDPAAAGIDTHGASLAMGPASSASSGGGNDAVRITADTINNSLLIYSSKEQYRFIEATIRQIDQAPEQVAIEATIAEVALTNQLQYGVQAYLESRNLGLGTGNGAGGFTSSSSSPLVNAVVPGGNLILGSTVSPRIVLNALHALTSVKILSSPSLVVLDNQTASLQVGNQVAIKTQSSQSTDSTSAPVINNITYKDTGIILNVAPRVGADGVVTLDIQQEISNVVDNSGGRDGLTPTISQRRVKSQIAVPSGQTVMLAGLISNKTTNGRSGLPGSQNWGFLGELLSTHDNHAERNELVIFIKPQVIHDQFDAQAAAEQFRARLDALNSAYRRPRG
ncbi:type II secretion system protein GspD [Xaviernesmea oryzae]|uniref:Type II secretion system protein GspD n=1 Tax=Xaviernesmea oryzae TaxID=464029 RepID=A0A1Q9AQP5_9HYPH|nr:type II secretion system secretin GspD [Xaviernesmea oryzae]OLP57742.1 type II secretion system protein GspD [Xaviernesmea oryzae]SEM06340.1 type II secretion system protein D (GspD) [Xaviernesmea oryzae]